MDKLLAPLDELDKLTAKELTPEKMESKIPIPSIAHLTKLNSNHGKADNQVLIKYQKEYDLFCSWSALPKDLRKPPTAVAFEKRHLLPKGYTNYFKSREDYPTKRWTAFWDWMMDLYPDVVYAVYSKATMKGDSKAAGIFVDLVSKRMNLDKPRVTVQPMVLMGVPQDQIDALFTPKDYSTILDVPKEK